MLLTTSTNFNSPVRAGQQTTPGCSQMTLLPALGLTQFSFPIFPYINLSDAVPNDPSWLLEEGKASPCTTIHLVFVHYR